MCMKTMFGALLFFGACSGIYAAANFNFEDGVLTIVTERYEVVWRDGCMVQVTDKHNGNAPLTVAPDNMAVSWLPNGPGSFFEHAEAGHDQHRPLWSHRNENHAPTFPAQYPAYEGSAVTCEKIAGGVVLTYRGLQADATGWLKQELTVETETGDLVIRQQAGSNNPGLFGIGFSILNLKSEISFALPYFSGVKIGGAYTNGISGWAWPGFWSAGLIIGETPTGGSFFVFADDAKLSPKYFKLYSTAEVQGIGFEACGQYPYGERRETAVFDWRFNTFAGSWMEPAERYKQWLSQAYNLKPNRQNSPAWYHDIGMYCTSPHNDFSLFAEKIDPKHVMVVNYGWAQGFNRNAPFYQPHGGDTLSAKISSLNDMGYRYGVYVAHKLIDLNPVAEVRKQHWGDDNLLEKYRVRVAMDALSRMTPQLDEDWRDADVERVREATEQGDRVVLAGIHAGSDEWIEFYADLMVDYHKRYGIDVFYQDVSGSHYGSSGLIDGRSIHEGTVASERRVREKLPQIITVGEHWNEVNVAAGMELSSGSYAAWFSPDHHKMLGGERAHPIKGYIFSDYTGLVMYKTPLTSTEQFHRDQNFLEITGSMPTWRAAVTPDPVTAEKRLVLERARLFAQGFRPYYPRDWEKDAVAYMRAPDGQTVSYIRRDGSTFCYLDRGADGKGLYYARVTGRSALPMDEPVHIDGWLAYNNDGPIGLSPELWYSVFPGSPEDMPVKFTQLPDGTHINGGRVAEAYILVDIGGNGSGAVTGIAQVPLLAQPAPGQFGRSIKAPGALLLALQEAPKVNPGDALPLQDWSVLEVVNGLITRKAEWWRAPHDWTLGDATYRGFSVTPPAGGPGAEISIDGYLQLPEDDRVALAFQMGRFGGAGDGVHFVVRVNGVEIWRELSPAGERGWTPAMVPLQAYSGQNIVLSLALDCGPSRFNTSNDHSAWGAPTIVMQEVD